MKPSSSTYSLCFQFWQMYLEFFFPELAPLGRYELYVLLFILLSFHSPLLPIKKVLLISENDWNDFMTSACGREEDFFLPS